ncbi:hypothetical protein RND81_11G145100 [Saponaria officinalis]|uniref:Protein kinase domain-containing protein n=1 Tax=Saponaria officinalis TaxID=3572 RepID=A0AAW1HNS7_SAPOF
MCILHDRTITNNCNYTIRPGISGTTQKTDSGFALLEGESRVVAVGKSWTGRVWGRTTGDCGTGIECTGQSLTFPVTLADFSFSIINNNENDFYDVTVAQGYNLPLMVAPNVKTGAGCDVTGCVFDLKKSCIAELAVLSDPTSSSSIIVCRGLCDVDKACCNSTAGCSGLDSPFSPLIYKKPCPRAYSFPVGEDEDDASFRCDGSKVSTYNIIFCPSPSMSRQHQQEEVAYVSGCCISNSRAAVLLFLLGICVCICRRKAMKENNGEGREKRGRRVGQLKKNNKGKIVKCDSLQFDFNTIRSATRNFAADNKLGGGGFGDIYKGELEDGQEIAVKRLSKNSVQEIAEFETKIVLVAKLQHKNLVNLLIYEFLPNSSLDKFLFDPVRKSSLDWQTRLKIITGIGRGLLYLHEDSRVKIVHQHLKTSNILFDEAMNPKITDFGLARLFEVDQTQSDTKRIVGTYIICSFRVIVLEIVSGQRNRFFRQLLWNEDEAMNLVDTDLGDGFEREEPRMTTIVAALNRQAISLPAPKPPNFFGCVSFQPDFNFQNIGYYIQHTLQKPH